MKKLNFILSISFILFFTNFIQSQNVILNSQADLDNFNPTTTTINGDLVIEDLSSSPIVDLSNLSNLTSIQGDLEIISCASITHIDDLSNLMEIGSVLTIENNSSLLNVNGLSNVSSIGRGVEIKDNDVLMNVDGFSNFTTFNNEPSVFVTELPLSIQNNDALTNLNGFANLTTIHGKITISIRDNDALTSIDGFTNLTPINAYLDTYIINNNSLTSVTAFAHLSSIGLLSFQNNDMLTNLSGFANITSIAGGLSIKNNSSLININDLINLNSLFGNIRIEENNVLANLDGLANLTSVGGYLLVGDNPSLTDCCGIETLIDNSNNLYIYNNPLPCSNEANIVSSCNPNNSTLYVDISAQGSNLGNSWTNAFTDLQDALAIGGDTIHIAEGTYLPSQNGTRGSSFDIPFGMTILGGYSTGGSTRDPDLYETILSGNVDNISSAQGNSFHVVTIKDADNVELNGLTIRDGNADNASSYARSRGGGLYINNSVVELKDVEVKWNRALYGAAMFAKFSDITIRTSTFKKNRADYGAVFYYSNESNLNLYRSDIVDNTSNIRCALESNNASSTIIKNCIFANNVSANANALGFIATNRNATAQIINSTILGENANKNLISVQVGNNDQMDLTIHNSIVAHQNSSFDKNIVIYNNNVFNFNHSNCYFSGSSISGTGTNNLFADTAGDLLLNSDYTVDECSPVVNAGSDVLGPGSQDYFGNPRYFNTIDIGAYEAQTACIIPRKSTFQDLEVSLFPNPVTDDFTLQIAGEKEWNVSIYDALSRKVYSGKTQGDLIIKTSDWANGIYILSLSDSLGNIKGHYKILKK